jgi:hypothetical protein
MTGTWEDYGAKKFRYWLLKKGSKERLSITTVKQNGTGTMALIAPELPFELQGIKGGGYVMQLVEIVSFCLSWTRLHMLGADIKLSFWQITVAGICASKPQSWRHGADVPC